MRQTRREFVALGVGAIPVATAGCLRLRGADATTAAELERQLGDLDRPETMTGTVEATFDRDGTTTVTVDVVTARASGETYVEGTTDDATFRNVDDGERVWFHDLERDRIAVLDSEMSGESHIEYIYGETTTYFDQLEAKVSEETTLDGRDVYQVRFDPPPDKAVERSISVLAGNTEFVIPLETEERETTELQETVERIDVWFDRETLFPVKQVVETDAVDFDAIYTSLELNEPVSDDPFAFDPPDDALVEEHVFPYLDRYDALADAEADAGITMAEPTCLPKRFARATAAVADYPYADDLREVSVRYAGDESVGESIRVGACNGPRPFDVAGEAVTVNGASGTVAESDLGTTVEWPCGERTYVVFATASVERETALSVAESIDDDCE
ncbi:hypothetical protein JMJ58_01460 [Haloterrigena salifodinae]|uniref:Outer membrane lipoprotein carrier protein LolA n=1 Tax=Haloterrigena salifodinae TaxID=2675099 RepID=A0A8T8E2E3_9EURY|nr:hypothetical protein [Haloterrigena salifodinae]QRV15600.1 hypothetical protein JMJ58_01460 [Haloterrigena salifodinae]